MIVASLKVRMLEGLSEEEVGLVHAEMLRQSVLRSAFEGRL